jgi:hypothetical protein
MQMDIKRYAVQGARAGGGVIDRAVRRYFDSCSRRLPGRAVRKPGFIDDDSGGEVGSSLLNVVLHEQSQIKN